MNQPAEPTPPEGRQDPVRPYILEDPLVRFDARVLDPTTAVRRADGEAPSPTVYVGDTFLVTADSIVTARGLLTALDAAVGQSGIPLRRLPDDPFRENDDPEHDRRARLLQSAAQARLPLVFPVRFVPNEQGPTPAVDVWALVQSIRQAASGDDADADAVELSAAVGLNHLMQAAANVSGNPYTRGLASVFGSPYTRGLADVSGNPYTRGLAGGVVSYAAAGSGGRGPVSVVLGPPLRTPGHDRPHVVVLDTGVGAHPWFTAQPVTLGMQYQSTSGALEWIGMDPNEPTVVMTDPEGIGAVPDPMTGQLGSHSGHGTFIAGLLRQACPDADITAIRVMDSDGVVPEVMLTDALTALEVVQSAGQGSIDALVLSLGYYSETGQDVTYTAGLRSQLLALSAMGVAVFCAAGNDSSLSRLYPAAFCDDVEFRDGSHLPMASVAALNPDRTVALFSNEGEWVNAEASGAGLVSTAPTSAQGSWTADTLFSGPRHTRRATIDPDAFSSGFCTWSGTSFAAPVLAGRFLARLATQQVPRTIADRQPLIGLGRSGDEPA